MKPSDIELAPVPLVGTMGRCETELAAALLVHTCAVLGDQWQPLTLAQVQGVLSDDVATLRAPFMGWMTNPFLRPDVSSLVLGGWARWVDHPGGTVELTEMGLGAIARWRRREAVLS
jgi:hypothetical protein